VSFACADFFKELNISVAFCCLFDGSVFFFAYLAYVLSHFDTDKHMGVVARLRGLQTDITISGTGKIHNQ